MAEWSVKRETAPGQFNTLHAGTERSARQYARDNFPRPHVVMGQDAVRADVQVHGPAGEKFEYHGQDAVGADEDGWVNLNQSNADDIADNDNDEDDEEGPAL